MKYVLKVSDCDSFVEGFCIDPKCDPKYVLVDYTDNPEKALTFDDINEAIFHLVFIRANASSTDSRANYICIAEAQTYFKELKPCHTS